jgi:hypothetical protein
VGQEKTIDQRVAKYANKHYRVRYEGVADVKVGSDHLLGGVV